jgi:hypothetical protein
MKLLKYILPVFILFLVVACQDDDDATVEPPRPFSEQYVADTTAINNYLRTHYITVINAPGFTTDMDVVITEIPDGGTQTPIWDMPNLEKRTVNAVAQNQIYEVYYLNLRQGIPTNAKPCNFDSVFVSYRGTLLNGSQFENVVVPSTMVRLEAFVGARGFSEIFPLFNTGTYSNGGDGTTIFEDFGAGVIFQPSGLGYYNVSQVGIPAYSPTVFSFKLYEIERIDHDNDGIPTYLEDIDGDGYITAADDTDGDGIWDFRDIDDDGDQILTKNELKIPDTNPVQYYTFDNVPDCNGNTTNPNRLRKYRDPICN